VPAGGLLSGLTAEQTTALRALGSTNASPAEGLKLIQHFREQNAATAHQAMEDERQRQTDARLARQEQRGLASDAAQAEERRLTHERQAEQDRNARLPTGMRMGPDGVAEQIPGVPKTGVGKPLQHVERAKLIETATKIDQVGQAITDFQDDYGGFHSGTYGDFANLIARNTPGESPRADWWQGYQRYKLQVRQGISGQSLTKTEMTEFEKADINPGMSAVAIRANLGRQREIMSVAQDRLARSLAAEGIYNRDAIEEASGVRLDDAKPHLATTPGAAAVTKPALPPLPPGFKVHQ